MQFSNIYTYRRNGITPDHLIAGLLRNLVECGFYEIESASTVILRHPCMKDELRQTGSEMKTEIFNIKIKTLSNTLHIN